MVITDGPKLIHLPALLPKMTGAGGVEPTWFKVNLPFNRLANIGCVLHDVWFLPYRESAGAQVIYQLITTRRYGHVMPPLMNDPLWIAYLHRVTFLDAGEGNTTIVYDLGRDHWRYDPPLPLATQYLSYGIQTSYVGSSHRTGAMLMVSRAEFTDNEFHAYRAKGRQQQKIVGLSEHGIKTVLGGGI